MFAFCLFLSPLLKRILTFGGDCFKQFPRWGPVLGSHVCQNRDFRGNCVSEAPGVSQAVSALRRLLETQAQCLQKSGPRTLHGVRKPGGEGGSRGLRERQRRDDGSFSTCGGSPPPPGSPSRAPQEAARGWERALTVMACSRSRSSTASSILGVPAPPTLQEVPGHHRSGASLGEGQG